VAEDLRQRMRFAASMTALGLAVDLANVLTEASVRFALIHRWPEAAAYFIVGAITWSGVVLSALSRVRAEVRRG